MAATDVLADRILIRETYGRYALGAAQREADAWIACWARNGVWKTPHFEVAGHAALRAQWDATWLAFSNVAAFYEVGAIAVDGDGAITVFSVYEIIKLAQGPLLRMAGLYRDRFVREDGEWHFARRDYELLSQEAGA